VSPIDYSKYPSNWKEIRARILERAGNRCEQCGVPNYFTGKKGSNGKWYTEDEVHSMNSTDGDHLFGHYDNPFKMVRIVLTIAHLNHDISDNREENLKALCQADHLALDKDLHIANAKKTREKKMGTLNMFP